MSIVLGTNSGFVTTRPTADPVGTDTVIDGASVVTKHTSPTGSVRITEIGWYRGSGTNAANFEIALYGEAGGVAGTRLFVDATNSSTSAGWIITTVDWSISANTAYWLGLQMDAHTGSSNVDTAISGGAGIDRLTSQTALADPYGGGAVLDADGMYAIYALVEVTTPVTINLATATVSALGIASTVVGGAVTKILDTALVTVAGQTATVSSQIPSTTINLATAVVSAVAQATSVVKGAITKVLDTATLVANTISGSVLKGAVSITLATALLVANGQSATASAPITTQLATANLIASGQTSSIIEGETTVLLNTANVLANGIHTTVSAGAIPPITINLNTATLNALGQNSTILEGESITTLATAGLIANVQAVTINKGGITTNLSTALLEASGQVLDIQISDSGPQTGVKRFMRVISYLPATHRYGGGLG